MTRGGWWTCPICGAKRRGSVLGEYHYTQAHPTEYAVEKLQKAEETAQYYRELLAEFDELTEALGSLKNGSWLQKLAINRLDQLDYDHKGRLALLAAVKWSAEALATTKKESE